MTTTREAALGLTPQQKLEALSLRFYQGLAWEPKAGDHYTTSRADLELYQVVSVEDGVIKTRYCNNKTTAISEWKEDGFLSSGFGPRRVWVPDFVLSMKPAALSTPATEPQGCVEGLSLKRIVEEIDGAMKHGTWRDDHGMRLKDTPEWVEFYNSIAARSAPQPAADTRVVTVAQLERWSISIDDMGYHFNTGLWEWVAEEIRAIIGEAGQ